MELSPYLKSTYLDEILECTFCTEVCFMLAPSSLAKHNVKMVTKGAACHKDNCKVRMHFHCFKTFRRQKDKCPVCAVAWPREAKDKPLLPVGEAAAREGDDRKRRVRATKSDHGSDEEEEEEELEDSQPSQPKASQRTKKGRKAREDSYDSDE
jgi:hypothetical protein